MEASRAYIPKCSLSMYIVFLNLGFIKIYWYAVLILLSFLIGGYLALKQAKKQKISLTFMNDYCFYLIPVSILGARIYFVLFNLDYYSNNLLSVLKVWEGGLAIHGGIIAALLFTYIYTKKHEEKFLELTDILCIPLLLGQAIGRWGNFLNQEAYGPEIGLDKLQSFNIPQFIIDGMHIGGVHYTPTFLYESIWCIIGFTLFLIIRKFSNTRKYGIITSLYLIWYGIGRFFIEGLRQDSLMLGEYKIAQLVSIGMIIIGFISIIIINIIYKRRK